MEKTIEIQLQELREQIANEIEDRFWEISADSPVDVAQKIIKECVKIARGK